MTTTSGIRIAAAVTCLASASIAGAQQLDATDLAKPKVESASCNEIVWQEQLVARYPRIAQACQEVVIAEGGKFARFAGELVRVNPNGSVRIDFKDRQGQSLGQPTFQPAPGQRVQIDGKRYAFSELTAGQELNLYVPERSFAIATEPRTAPEAIAQILPDDEPAAVEATPTRVAEATPAPAAAERLPDTAGSLPWLGLAGIVTLLGGLVVSIRRRLRAPVGA